MRRDLPHVVRQAQIAARADDELKEQLKFNLRKISEFSSEIERIQWVRNEVDRFLEESTSESKCLKGCHFCCFHPIALSTIEMKDIQKERVDPEFQRLKKQKEHFENQTDISYEDRACIYLKEGECSVYDKRPLICRLTHVSSNPEDCHFENDQKPIQHLPVTKAALVVGAFYMAHPNVEIMPLLIEEN
ncbi:MAG: YkgJ family cysteine cluster protein [Deltaproteobacteria bacterium]|nr:MAG: YkgJ family cysteine cluster protein [Deltaproteobacteria bacterium]